MQARLQLPGIPCGLSIARTPFNLIDVVQSIFTVLSVENTCSEVSAWLGALSRERIWRFRSCELSILCNVGTRCNCKYGKKLHRSCMFNWLQSICTSTKLKLETDEALL